MLDLARLDRITLTAAPRFQRFVALTLLMPNYHLPPRVRIVFEDEDRVPDHPVVFAMNHTDRFNYWPFQYMWWRRRGRYTATWVKGKYYESPLVGAFMELTNNIPTVSRGYIITRDFVSTMGRRPTDEEYRALRRLVDAAAEGEAPTPDESVPRTLLRARRDMLGRRFDPARDSYPQAIDALFRRMMRRFVELNREAVGKGLDLLIFPEGTRSIRLSKGHMGLAQLAMHLGSVVIPVGCSGSDRVYPGSSPIARPGRIVYRFGEPIRPGEGAAWVDEPFEPFTLEAERAHGAAFQAYVDDVMRRLDGLVDERHRSSADEDGGAVEGSARFL